MGLVHPWVGSEMFMVEMGWVGFSYQNVYIFNAIILIKLCKSVIAIYPQSVNSSEVPPVRRCVLLIYSLFVVRGLFAFAVVWI